MTPNDPSAVAAHRLDQEPQAAELRDLLIEALDHGALLRVDAGAVTALSTACIQVLLATDRSCAARGGRLHLTDTSPAFAESLASLGLGAELRRWQGEVA